MSSPGVSSLERVEAILHNEAIYQLAALIPDRERGHGGRPRDYPALLWLIYEALVSVYGSARQVEAEIAHPTVWKLVRRTVRARLGRGTTIPLRPMRRHHYLYGRYRYLTDPEVLEALGELHREIAVEQARELGLFDPNGAGSWTHPHLSRMLHADGKVITPLYRAKPGDHHVDRATGEIRALRAESDAGLHFEGDGEAAWGIKYVLVAARTPDQHGRVILDLEWVPSPGGEARTALECFDRLAPLLPGAQGVIYDTALRGVHHQHLLRNLGWLPINRVTAAQAGSTKPRRGAGRRVAKDVHVEDKVFTDAKGRKRTCRIYARDGAVGIGQLSDTGKVHFEPLPRVRTHRNRDKSGRFRWYNDYALPDSIGGGIITVRLHGTADDEQRRFNRTENVRPIPPSDPDFPGLFLRRNDAESINRGLEDSLYLRRAHSVGHRRQQLNLLGFALMVNSVAIANHRRRRPTELAA